MIQTEKQKAWSQRNKVSIHFFEDLNQTEEFLNYENSHILLTDIMDTDLPQANFVLKKIYEDPWLHGTVVLGFVRQFSNEMFESLAQHGVVDLIEDQDYMVKLGMILQTITNNIHVFSQSQLIQTKDKTTDKAFKIRNNLSHAHYAVNFIMLQCYSLGYRDKKLFSRIALTLTELIFNAIEHGNCGISHEQKSEILDSDQAIDQVIQKLASSQEVKNKYVHIAYRISPHKAQFYIRDEGQGFDVQKIPKPNDDKNMFKSHGRGILIVKHNVDKIEYNELGNAVKVTIINKSPVKPLNYFPIDLKELERVELKENEILFEDHSLSDNFYFILKGSLAVYVNNKMIAKVGPEDIFIGEMSFLLNNLRTGTVKALTNVSLIAISRKQFIDIVKKYPYFAVFLSRILANRLAEQNQKLSKQFIPT